MFNTFKFGFITQNLFVLYMYIHMIELYHEYLYSVARNKNNFKDSVNFK